MDHLTKVGQPSPSAFPGLPRDLQGGQIQTSSPDAPAPFDPEYEAEFSPIYKIIAPIFKLKPSHPSSPTPPPPPPPATAIQPPLDPAALFNSPFIAELRALLFTALKPYDEAFQAVLNALVPWELRWTGAG
jgi:hypothetical protein